MQQMAAPLTQVEDPRGHPLGVQRDPEHVRGRFEQLGCDPPGHQRDTVVGRDQVPMTVDDRGRIRAMRVEEAVERLAHRRQLLILERALREERRKASRQQ